MSAEPKNYEISPANTTCSNIHKTVIVSNPGSPVNNTQTHINAMKEQHIEDSKYDSPQLDVKPLYGGKNNNIMFNILFRKKIYIINEKNIYYKKTHIIFT